MEFRNKLTIRLCLLPVFGTLPATSPYTSTRLWWSPANSSVIFPFSHSLQGSRSSFGWPFYPCLYAPLVPFHFNLVFLIVFFVSFFSVWSLSFIRYLCRPFLRHLGYTASSLFYLLLLYVNLSFWEIAKMALWALYQYSDILTRMCAFSVFVKV